MTESANTPGGSHNQVKISTMLQIFGLFDVVAGIVILLAARFIAAGDATVETALSIAGIVFAVTGGAMWWFARFRMGAGGPKGGEGTVARRGR